MDLYMKHFGNIPVVYDDHPNVELFIAELNDLCKDVGRDACHRPKQKSPCYYGKSGGSIV